MTKMKLIGRIGLFEEGREVFLYQCPKCKSINFNFENGLECKECVDEQSGDSETDK